jgi:hypothetical protein
MADQPAIPADRTDSPPSPLQGQRSVRPSLKSIARLHGVGAERDKAGNRKLFYDRYIAPLLVYFCGPAPESLRAWPQATGWAKARHELGIEAAALGSLSEAARAVDADPLRPIVQPWAARALPLSAGREGEALRGTTAVEGSIFAARPRMAGAPGKDADHRGVQLHWHCDGLQGVPADATLTPAACSEGAASAAALQPGRLDGPDRGDADDEWFARIVTADSSRIARAKDDTAFVVPEERPSTAAAEAAGVVRDVVISRRGTSPHKDHLQRAMRPVIVRIIDRDGQATERWLITDRLDRDAELVAPAYRYRWSVELFFGWLKCALGARPPIATDRDGVTMPRYAAWIVSLLIVLRTGREPTKRTFETIRSHRLGWVSDEEFDAHLGGLPAAKEGR